RRLQQMPNHGPQLLGVAPDHPESIALLWSEFALPAVEEMPRIPQNRHQRRAKFVRHIGEQLIFPLELLLAGLDQGGGQSLSFDRIAYGARQELAVHMPVDPKIL